MEEETNNVLKDLAVTIPIRLASPLHQPPWQEGRVMVNRGHSHGWIATGVRTMLKWYKQLVLYGTVHQCGDVKMRF
jgi:hypothetical protein